jgi:putative ABC transport system permease protein
MRVIDAALQRIRSFLLLRRADRALDDEMQFHLEMETSRLIAGGMTPDAARAEAVRSFGGMARHRDEARDQRGISLIEDFLTDLRLGLRSFRRHPAFTAVVVLTLGVGIGTVTSIFGTVYGVLLAPLPYHDPSRILVLWQRNVRSGWERAEVAPGNFLDWQERNRTFERIAAAEPWSLDFVSSDGPVSLNTAVVSDGFFETFRVAPLLGRTLQSSDYAPNAPMVVVISEKAWRRRFNADPTVVGRSHRLDSMPRTIVGVMPGSFDLPHGEEVWAPKIFQPDERQQRSGGWFSVVGRLRDGVTLEQANADLLRLSLDISREYPTTNASTRTWAEPIETTLFGRVRGALYVLLGAAAFVLAIVCANAGALIVTHTLQRDRELAVRVALGAGRARLIRQLLAETAALSAAGGMLGVCIAIAGTATIRRLAPVDLPRVEAIGVNVPVLAFTAAVSILTSLLSALAAAGALRRAAGTSLLIGAPSTVGRRAQWTRPVLAGVESALALVLVVGAALLIRSFATLTGVDRGFTADGLAVTTVQAWDYYPTGADRVTYVNDALSRLRALPGVSSVAATTSLPLSPGITLALARVTREGAPPDAEPLTQHLAAVSNDYFGTMRIALRAGRTFTAADGMTGPPVAIVSESFARQWWPGEKAVGKRIRFGFRSAPELREVVGVVADVRQRSLEADPTASVYMPHAQSRSGAVSFVVRANNPVAITPFVRRTLTDMNGVMPLEPTFLLSEMVDGSVRERRFHLALLSAFAAVALGLAMLGIYGVTNQAATERTREIGLRVALGATGGDIVRLVVRQGAVIVGVGVGVGVVAAVGFTRVLRALLYGVTPLDPIAFVTGVGLLFGVAILASWIPARRASSVDPVRALRAD